MPFYILHRRRAIIQSYMLDVHPHLIHGSLVQQQSASSNRIYIGSAVLQDRKGILWPIHIARCDAMRPFWRVGSGGRRELGIWSVLQPSLTRGLATPWTYFLHLSLSSVNPTDSSTGYSKRQFVPVRQLRVEEEQVQSLDTIPSSDSWRSAGFVTACTVSSSSSLYSASDTCSRHSTHVTQR